MLSTNSTVQDVVSYADAVLDDKLETILLSGYSRFPVHEPHDPDSFVGLLLMKKVGGVPLLLVFHPHQMCIISLSSRDPPTNVPSAYASKKKIHLLTHAPSSPNTTSHAHSPFGLPALDPPQGTAKYKLLLGAGLFQNPVGLLVVGVITLEDIIEEYLSEEIVDETDRYEDNITQQQASRNTTAAVMRGCGDGERTPLAADARSIRSLSLNVGWRMGGYGSTRQ
ncbi:hypothetical protein B0H13DRAFT_2537432 [Mycena leptocephala]|nr:hypothetical protein B0H13DRAFT_2537432 [Mycena leptocephala]